MLGTAGVALYYIDVCIHIAPPLIPQSHRGPCQKLLDESDFVSRQVLLDIIVGSVYFISSRFITCKASIS